MRLENKIGNHTRVGHSGGNLNNGSKAGELLRMVSALQFINISARKPIDAVGSMGGIAAP
jgi:hypothetical protein